MYGLPLADVVSQTVVKWHHRIDHQCYAPEIRVRGQRILEGKSLYSHLLMNAGQRWLNQYLHSHLPANTERSADTGM
jgi:hypothetical protein